jgi:crossover junction endodeoxyribonuclease RuvC
MTNVLGCDPGYRSGALAVFDGEEFAGATQIKNDGDEIDANWMATWIKQYKIELAVMEQVHAMPKQGVTSMFNFGRAYGAELAIIRLFVPKVIIVSPLKWKTILLSRNGYTREKDSSIRFIEDRFSSKATKLLMPRRSRKPNHNVAEAMCLAVYGWEQDALQSLP